MSDDGQADAGPAEQRVARLFQAAGYEVAQAVGVEPGTVFEPYFTTKKGGDQPLGTGMGLSIARRYAERIGAVVGLDPERRPTCFFVRLVAWRDT